MIYTYNILGNYGRLGNQLFQIASTIGIANLQEGEASFPSWKYTDYFNISKSLFDERSGYDFSGNYLQDYHYFEHCDSLIKDYFSPSKQSQIVLGTECPDFFNGLQQYDFINVHVRRGDYLGLPNHHPVCGLEYYEKGIDIVKAKLEKPFKLIVFSDDLAWCKQQSTFKDAVFADQFKTYTDVFDMFLMTYCKGHVLSNSTFSWWGAYLSSTNNVAYPDPWYGPALLNIDVKNTLILPEWVAVNR